jgi:hypothetical protein
MRIYKSLILPVCETWSLTSREEHGLKVLRRIFGPKRDEVTSKIRMIKSRRMRWAGNVTRMGRKRNACRLLDGKTRKRRSVGGWIILR